MIKISLSLLMLLLFTEISLSNDVFEGKTSIENPFELRDPFVPPKIKSVQKKKITSKKADGVFDNRQRIDSVKSYKLDEISIVGVVIGKERRVSIKLSKENDVFVLKEGDKLGQNKAEIKAILPGGIILVEKVSNIYGEDEYIETVIPISR